MSTDNSRHLLQAARNRSELTRIKAAKALQRLDRSGEPVTFEAVARAAGVSRSWLYAQPDFRSEIQQRRARRQPVPAAPLTPHRQRASEASLLRRLEAANGRLERLGKENLELRQALAEALGAARTAGITSGGKRVDTPGPRTAKTIGPC